MTERFLVDDCGTLIDKKTRNTYDYVSEVWSLLNDLSEENEQLKSKYYWYKQCKELLNENEELKRQIGNLEHTRDFCADVCADCERLEKENEQLKCENELLRNSLEMRNGKREKVELE